MTKASQIANARDNCSGASGTVASASTTCVNGSSPGLYIGSVVTLPCSEAASVSIDSVSSNATVVLLDFSIPEGCPGAHGINASCSQSCENGTDAVVIVTITLSNGSTIVYNGTAFNLTINITGDSNVTLTPGGPDGPQGIPGLSASIVVANVTTTLGGNATVINAGDAIDAILNFTIPQGEAGIDGLNGSFVNISAGLTFISGAGSDATVEDMGPSPESVVLQFTIPTGDTGTHGLSGVSPTVEIGSVVTTDADTNATVTNSGNATNVILDFTIPRGVQGDNGTGAAASIDVGNTTTGIAGSLASVVNAAPNDVDVILNFTIPRGAVGDTGSDGNPGSDGANATIIINITDNGNETNVTEIIYNVTAFDIHINITENATFISSPGPQGNPGIDGINGTAPTFEVGSTANGDVALVTNAGTSNALILDFIIPRGLPGANGTLTSIVAGNTTTTAPGTLATVVNAGTVNAVLFNVTIPRGDAGRDGTNGVDGTNATILLTVTNNLNQTNVSRIIYNVSLFNVFISIGENATLISTPGPPGTNGRNGTSASVTIGATTTGLVAGANASVTNTGTAIAPIFNFTIPAGISGQNGTSTSVTVGSVTTTSAPSPATIVNTGSASALILNFTIPQGAQGTNGTTGTPTSLTVGNVTSTAPNTQATITNAGTANNLILNFTIPQGLVGASGTNGTNGATGTSTSLTVGSTTTGAVGSNAAVSNTGTVNDLILHFTIPGTLSYCGGAYGTNGAVMAINSATRIFHSISFPAAVLNGFSLDTANDRLTYTGTTTQYLCVTLTVTFTTNVSGYMYFWIGKNGIEYVNSQVISAGVPGQYNAGITSAVVQSTTNDYFEAYVLPQFSTLFTLGSSQMMAWIC